jgi:hypothetical protein
MRHILILLLSCLFLASASIPGFADGGSLHPSVPNPKSWQFEAGAYLFASRIDGDAGIRTVDAEVDVSFGDILENLEFGVMGFLAGRNEKWSIIADALYMKLTDESSFAASTVIPASATLEIVLEQAMIEGFVGRRILTGRVDNNPYRVDLLGGLRYNRIKGELDATATVLGLTTSGSRSRTVDWVDPVVGVRGEIWPTPKLRLFTLLDYGGFGVGADSTWQAIIGGVYQFENRTNLIVGYRALGMEYEDGSGTSRIKLDLIYSGPMIGVSYRF